MRVRLHGLAWFLLSCQYGRICQRRGLSTSRPRQNGRHFADASFKGIFADESYCMVIQILLKFILHDDVIKWKHFPRNWPFVREINRSPVNFPHKGQWRGALIYAWMNDWVNNREAGDLRRQHGHYDVIVMKGNMILPLIEVCSQWSELNDSTGISSNQPGPVTWLATS